MSDTVFTVTPETIEAEEAEEAERIEREEIEAANKQRFIDQRLANLARARSLRGQTPPPPPPKNKGGRPPGRPPGALNQRTAEVRTPEVRIGADAVYAGVGSNPGAAEPSRPTREPVVEEVLTRVRRDERDQGWADIPKHLRKGGWDYEWKTVRVYNEPVDPGEMLEARNAGWRPEKAIDWPDLVEPGAPPDAPIERRGLRLYGRPMRLTQEARQEDLQAAYQQQRDKTMAAATGRSAIRNEEGIPTGRAVRSVPISVEIEGLAG